MSAPQLGIMVAVASLIAVLAALLSLLLSGLALRRTIAALESHRGLRALAQLAGATTRLQLATQSFPFAAQRLRAAFEELSAAAASSAQIAGAVRAVAIATETVLELVVPNYRGRFTG
jgi:hypothetical protein